MATLSLIELLEPRIAPATFVNAFVVNYTDVDGDLVKVKSSKPIFHDDLREFTFMPGGEGEALSELLLKPSASGADLKIKVIETGAAGDGSVNVGYINATGVDLRTVIIEGALERISVGDMDSEVRGIGLLHVGSLGAQSVGEPEGSSNLVFGAGIVRIDGNLTGKIETPTPGFDEFADRKPGDITRLFVGGELTGSVKAEGIIGKIKIAGNLAGSDLNESGYISASSIGKFVVQGSMIGASGFYSGALEARNGIGSVVVEGNIEGGEGYNSGGLTYGGNQDARLWLGGSLIGGSGKYSGMVTTGDEIDVIVVNGSILGGSGEYSGHVSMSGAWDLSNDIQIKIGADLIGGSGVASGSLNIQGQRTVNVAIGGDISGTLGSDGLIDYPHAHAGSIFGDRLGKVKIGGSLIAADRLGAEAAITSYAIQAYDSMEKLKVRGSIVGSSINLLGISAGAHDRYNSYDPTAGIGTLTVKGNVTYAEVSAGFYAKSLRPTTNIINFNADARIGEVQIDGDFIASSITAGIHRGADSIFGTADDHTQGRETTERRSRIESIIVGGQIKGTPISGDAFTISSQRVGSITIGGVAVPLTSGLDPIQFAPNTDDVFIREHV